MAQNTSDQTPAELAGHPDVLAVDAVFARARKAQQQFEIEASQERYDTAALAVAWALMEPERNTALATLSVEITGLGNVPDKIRKNHRKTLGLLRDIQGTQTTGVISDDKATGITEVARPIGVIGAVVPSTNPAATPANNMINALKCGNAIVLSPSPKGVEICERLIAHVHAEFAKVGIDPDLVQMVPAPSSKIKTQRLLEVADLVVVTGSQDNVRRGYSSGSPALGVGAGNATVIVDETADVAAAAKKITASKTFDNATSCSSENVAIVVRSQYEALMQAFAAEGGVLLNDAMAAQVKSALFNNGGLNRHMIAKDVEDFLQAAGLSATDVTDGSTYQADAAALRFVLLPGSGVGAEFPESGEKLSLALTLYVVDDFNAAMALAADVLGFQGAGHSIGLHSTDDSRALKIAHELPTCRVIVNQAHCFATGGSFDNGMPFSLSMGCGSWGGNSIDDNLNYRHFMNISRVVRVIPTDEPTVDSVFSHYWSVAGK